MDRVSGDQPVDVLREGKTHVFTAESLHGVAFLGNSETVSASQTIPLDVFRKLVPILPRWPLRGVQSTSCLEGVPLGLR